MCERELQFSFFGLWFVDFENMDKIVANGPATVENQFIVPKVVD